MNENLLYRGLDLSGLIASAVFLGSAACLVILSVISGTVGLLRGGVTKIGFMSQHAFGFFASAIVLAAVDLLLLGAFYLFGNLTTTDFKETLDKAAFYAWIPLQFIVWIASAIVIIKQRKTK